MSFKRNLPRCLILIFFFLLTSLSWQNQASAGQLQLTWTDNSNNEDGFKIDRKLGTNGTFSQITSVGVNVTTYSDTNLTDGATYCYRLAAFNSAGTSAYSTEGCATVKSALSITKIGSGTVTSSPAGINCGSACSKSYTSGTVVVLSAIPAAGSVFSGWTGSGCGSGSVTMNGSRSCTAVFNSQATEQVSRIGIFLPSIGGWYLDNGNGAWDGCGVDSCFAFGTLGDVPVPRDYDGDGNVDAAVYRDGTWFILRSSDGGVTETNWGGAPQDIPVPGDYDGDGKTDQAVYRDGVWWILRSSDGGGVGITWGGAPQDIPVPGDYDGDGKTDQAVYRDGVWWILRSSDGGGVGIRWGGAPQDIPVSGDYDGDGKTDQAVYRDGVWWILRSSDGGGVGITWGGAPQDIPVPGDYDGDGKTDQAVYRDGVWWILRSSDGGGVGIRWGGAPQDIPVPGDYDGDGKRDQAVYRDGMWWILRSSNGGGVGIRLGGAPQDIPLK